MSEIVVGVDGSPGSRRALAWALQEAQLRQVGVRLVHGIGARPSAYPEEAMEMLSQALDDAGGVPPGVSVERSAMFGSAVELLLEQAAEAELLVVGTRGRGGFAGLVLGSVSQQVVQHGPCPVVVVPPGED